MEPQEGISICLHCDHTLRPLQFDDHSWFPYLRSGGHPSQSQRIALENEVCLLKNHVAELQAEELAMQKRLEAMQAMREKAEKDVERRSSFLNAPIRRLPDELLFEIFHYVFPFSSHLKANGRPPFPTFLRPVFFALPFVCAWWRDIALRTPHMQPWIDLDIDARETDRERDGSLYKLPYAHLRLRIDDIISRKAPTNPKGLTSLDEHASRWSELHLRYPSWTVMKHICTDIPLPHLEKVTLGLYSPYSSGFGMLGMDSDEDEETWLDEAKASGVPCFFERAPALRTLVLNSTLRPEDMTSLPFSLPWHQFIDLSVNPRLPAEICVDLITRCTSLQNFALRDVPRNPSWYPRPPITDRTCTFHGSRISFEVGDLRNALPLLAAVSAPSITQLVYMATSGKETEPLFDFLDRSQCKLTHLELWWVTDYPTTSAFEGLIGRLPTLQHLKLTLGNTHAVISSSKRKQARALIDALCTLRRSGRLSHLVVLQFGSTDVYEQHVLTKLVPTFVYDLPVRELWLDTPLKRVKWVNEMPALAEDVQVYGMERCFTKPGPLVIMTNDGSDEEDEIYRRQDVEMDEDWDDEEDSEEDGMSEDNWW
ncbi:hypothetical protein BD626DRAFT_405523 [Schizophyllum amplum]|uniref:Uncharacterized protein n=1 Tax=Schizophyllum amplum TaxID=97359 RepID=A0A550C9D6_9AGAR|nr:hypothetical protein BD626DRAFT_405523 [Auriculariopsis ampla]